MIQSFPRSLLALSVSLGSGIATSGAVGAQERSPEQEWSCRTAARADEAVPLVVNGWSVRSLGSAPKLARDGRGVLLLDAIIDSTTSSSDRFNRLQNIRSVPLLLRGSIASTIPRPGDGPVGEWQVLDGAIGSDRVHVLWRAPNSSQLVLASSATADTLVERVVPGGDSLTFVPGQSGALVLEGSTVAVAAQYANMRSRPGELSQERPWTILRRLNDRWTSAPVSPIRGLALGLALLHDDLGTMMLVLKGGAAGVSWMTRYLAAAPSELHGNQREHPLAGIRTFGSIEAATDGESTLLAMKVLRGPDVDRAAREILLAARFRRGVLEVVDTIDVARSFSHYTVAPVSRDKLAVLARTSDGVAAVYLPIPPVTRSGDERRRWQRIPLLGSTHVELPLLGLQRDELWLYSTVSPEGPRRAPSEEAQEVRASRLVCELRVSSDG